MKHSESRFNLKFFSTLVAGTFLLQQVAFAAPALPAFSISQSKPYELSFSIPESIATIDDSYDAGSGRPLIYLFQDAHTNDSGQMNTAHTLDLILKNENIDTVFSEAAQGANSLSFLKEFASERKRKEVGLNYLRKGLLNGAEYLSLTGTENFEIWGVEDQNLYQESIQAWGEIAQHRPLILEKLYEIKRGLDLVKREIFSEDLARFDSAVWSFRNEEAGVTDHLDTLVEFSALKKIDLKRYKAVKQLKSIRKAESNIDFEKANSEQMRFIASLPEKEKKELIDSYQSEGHHPFKLKNGEHQSSKAFFVLLKEKLESYSAASGENISETYPEIFKYLKYMEMTQEADLEQILTEITDVENEIYQTLYTGEDQRITVEFSENIDRLSRLFEFKLTPQEFDDYRQNRRSFHPAVIAGFVNRKISEFGKNYEQVVVLGSGLDELIRDAESFYVLTYRRDLMFVSRMQSRMAAGDIQKAALITGGYHAPNLKALLKQNKYSYVSILPQVLHETDFNRYENLLLSQTEMPEQAKRIASNKQELNLQSRAAMVRLLRSGLFSPANRIGSGVLLSTENRWVLAKFLNELGVEQEIIDREVQRMLAKLEGGSLDATASEGEEGGRPDDQILNEEQQTVFLLRQAQQASTSDLKQSVERYAVAAAKLSEEPSLLNRLNDVQRGNFLAHVFQLQAAKLAPFVLYAILPLIAILPSLTGFEQQAVAGQIRVVLDESVQPAATEFEYRRTIEERYRPIERKDLLGFNYQVTQGFKGAQDYIDEGKVHEMLAPLLPKDSPVLKKYGLEALGRDHADLIAGKLGGKTIRVYYLPTPDGTGTAKDRKIQEDYRRVNEILNEAYKNHGIRVTLNHWMGLHEMPGLPKLIKNDTAGRDAVFKSVERTVALYGKEPWLLLWQLGNEPNYHIKDGKLSSIESYPFESYKDLIQFHAEAAIRLKAAEAKLGEDYRHPVFIGNGSLNELEAEDWKALFKNPKYDAAVDGLSINAYDGIDWVRGTVDLTQIRRGMANTASLAANTIEKLMIIGEVGFWASRDVEQQETQKEYLLATRDAFRDLLTVGGLYIFASSNERWKAAPGSVNESQFGVTTEKDGKTELKQWAGFDESWYQAAEGAGAGYKLVTEIPVGYDIENQRVTVYGQGPTDTWAG
ncbi:MAG: hypothetical protein KC649_00975, partial [Candidatus Omnitrophica bacterium]|nr:hypothetical protein [Candidatus Omnitrophota bacterium]